MGTLLNLKQRWHFAVRFRFKHTNETEKDSVFKHLPH